MPYHKPSHSEWQWQDASGRNHAVRWFKAQNSLIWSAWTDRPDGPQFEEGTRQTAEAFLQQGAPAALTPPPDLLDDLRAAITGENTGTAEPPRKRRGPLSWPRG